MKYLLIITVSILIPMITLASWGIWEDNTEDNSECSGCMHSSEFIDEDDDGLCDICSMTEDECKSHECECESSSESSEVHCEGGVCTIENSE